MTQTFLIPDLHGKPDQLKALLQAADILDSEGFRIQRDVSVVSIGDLLNGTLEDLQGDEESLLKSRDWIDKLIVGNHEIEYILPGLGMTFAGYHPAPHMISAYNALFRESKVIPALMVGETLVTHAGVHEYFDFKFPDQAYNAIIDVFYRLRALHENDGGEHFEFDFHGHEVVLPKETLISAVSKKRGGDYPFGGILWSDWDENKNRNFSQVVGHSPINDGPVLIEYKRKGTYTLNIDAGAKRGRSPVGVYLDEAGQVTEYVGLDK